MSDKPEFKNKGKPGLTGMAKVKLLERANWGGAWYEPGEHQVPANVAKFWTDLLIAEEIAQ